MATSGGVDVGATVVDCGSWVIRAGLAGDDSPRVLLPAAVGRRQVAVEGKGDLFGDALEGLPNLVGEVDELYNAGEGGRLGLPKWDVLRSVVEHTVTGSLGLSMKDTPLMLVEGSSTWGPDGRAAMAERVFEGMGAGSCFIARGSVMSSFSAGRSTSLVVDVGHQGAFATAVVDGYALEKSKQQSVLGGRVLSEYLLKEGALKANEKGIRARWELEDHTSNGSTEKQPAAAAEGQAEKTDAKQEEKDATGTAGKQNAAAAESGNGMEIDNPKMDSKKAFYRLRLMHDMKQCVCAIREAPEAADAEAGGAPATPATGQAPAPPTPAAQTPVPEKKNLLPTTYELPDGQIVDLGPELCERVPESLFDPTLLRDYSDVVSNARPLHRLAYDAASACDIDVRRELYGGLVLTGGSSLFPGVTERFQRELAAITPQMFKLRMAIPCLRQERASSSWIGGSILASLGTFHQMWMSKQEYDELGAIGINRKCP